MSWSSSSDALAESRTVDVSDTNDMFVFSFETWRGGGEDSGSR